MDPRRFFRFIANFSNDQKTSLQNVPRSLKLTQKAPERGAKTAATTQKDFWFISYLPEPKQSKVIL